VRGGQLQRPPVVVGLAEAVSVEVMAALTFSVPHPTPVWRRGPVTGTTEDRRGGAAVFGTEWWSSPDLTDITRP